MLKQNEQKTQLLVAALKEYANRENWGYYDPSGCPKGYGNYTDACFVGPEKAEEALKAYEKAQGSSQVNMLVTCCECGKRSAQVTEENICKTCWNRGYEKGI